LHTPYFIIGHYFSAINSYEVILRVGERVVAAALANMVLIQRAVAVDDNRQVTDEHPVGWIFHEEQLLVNKYENFFNGLNITCKDLILSS
jgi:hypothetical protein